MVSIKRNVFVLTAATVNFIRRFTIFTKDSIPSSKILMPILQK